MKFVPDYKQTSGIKLPLPNVQWVEFIYDYICSVYLYGRPDRTIQMMEHILFLTQVDAIKYDRKEFLGCNVYHFNGEVRIQRISDMLRTGEVNEFRFSTAVNIHLSSDYLDENIERAEQYYDWTMEQLQEKVQQCIDSRHLDVRYFFNEKYHSKKNRGYARVYAKGSLYPFHLLFRVFVLNMIKLFWVSTLLGAVIITITGMPDRKEAVTFGIMAVVLTPFVVWHQLWTNRWRREPTQYEIEHGYVED